MPQILSWQYWKKNYDAIFLALLLIAAVALELVALFLPFSLRQSSFPVKVGDVSSQDILAPTSLSFQSEVLTEQAKTDAELGVPDIFLPVDSTITRRQIEKLRAALSFISTVKSDNFSATDQKISDLAALSEIRFSRTLAEKILNLPDQRWITIQQETINVLEQVMRSTIREGREIEAQKSVTALISYAIPQDQASIVAELVAPFISPNSLFSKDETQNARAKAREAVKPVIRSFIAGEIIIRRGQLITPLMLESLQSFGLLQEKSSLQSILASLSLVAIITASICLYFYRRKFSAFHEKKRIVLITIFFLVFLFSVRFVIPNRTVLPYLFPLPAFGLTIGCLFPIEAGVVLSLGLITLAGFGLPNSLELILFYIFSTICGIAILGKGRRIFSFLGSSLAIGLAGSAVILAFRLNDSITDGVGIATLISSAFINGIASASLALLFQYIISQILGIVTPLQLLDLSRPDHPVLQFLLRNAPGTYQHSLQVSNLTEQAAESIGADSMLVRVGCLYHDIGKAANPTFFVENQAPGNINPHDNLQPAEAAQIIIRHISDGTAVARKYRIPDRIADFIREHHGMLLARYHYTRAVQAADNDPSKVDRTAYQYPGPKPRSKETALLMLADGCEARFRAESPKTDTELRALIKKVFDFLLQEGQLDDTVLTLRDLHQVAESFFSTFKNTYHPRLQYPEFTPTKSQQIEGEVSIESKAKQKAKKL